MNTLAALIVNKKKIKRYENREETVYVGLVRDIFTHSKSKEEIQPFKNNACTENFDQNIFVIPLVFRKLLYSDFFDSLLTSVPTFTIPCNFFLQNHHIFI